MKSCFLNRTDETLILMNVSVDYPSGKHVMQGLDELNLKESETVVQENLP